MEARAAQLSWIHSDKIMRRELTGEDLTIGRSSDADLTFDQPQVSRKHAVIGFSDDHFFIQDLASSYGTRLNGAQLRPHEPCRLRQGDRILIGKVELTFGAELEPREEATSAPGPKPMEVKLDQELAELRASVAAHLRDNLDDAARADRIYGLLDGELSKLDGFIHDKFREYEVLQEITQIIIAILDVRKLLSTALELVSNVLGADRGFIILYDSRHGELRSMIPRRFSREDNSAVEYDFTFSQTIAKSCFLNKGIIIIGDALRDQRFASSHSILASSIRSVVCIPLQKGNETVGVIYLDNLKTPNLFHEHQAEFLKSFSAQTALALENARLYTQAVTDSLTGLYNRKFINERIFEEMVRARRYARDCSLILLDIDHFKNVNDSLGHAAGDSVIERVAEILRENARTSDVVARYGGEEFLMLLTETDAVGAKSLAERVRLSIESADITVGDVSVSITVSCGVSGYREGFENKLAVFVAEADKALYRAKNGGRNRVCLAGEER